MKKIITALALSCLLYGVAQASSKATAYITVGNVPDNGSLIRIGNFTNPLNEPWELLLFTEAPTLVPLGLNINGLGTEDTGVLRDLLVDRLNQYSCLTHVSATISVMDNDTLLLETTEVGSAGNDYAMRCPEGWDCPGFSGGID